MSSVYLDCNATSPIEDEVMEIMRHYTSQEFGNSGSRTHEMGRQALKAVNNSRRSLADLLDADISDVIFTSGATEASNMAILGLEDHGLKENKLHILTSTTEHKATLEPLERLSLRGFEVEFLEVDSCGRISIDQIKERIRSDTLLISLIHANNETGVLNPIDELANFLAETNHDALLHIDAAQSFGKIIKPLKNQRIDLMSISSHKIYGPKGVGALLMRSRNYERPPLVPLMVGGGQERGLRPGTLPVPLIAGLGKAAELASLNSLDRQAVCESIREKALESFEGMDYQINGDSSNSLNHTFNISIPGINSEAAMIALKETAFISNGSACTSANYSLSHVLLAMGLPEERIENALRISWSHLTPNIDWDLIIQKLSNLK